MYTLLVYRRDEFRNEAVTAVGTKGGGVKTGEEGEDRGGQQWGHRLQSTSIILA